MIVLSVAGGDEQLFNPDQIVSVEATGGLTYVRTADQQCHQTSQPKSVVARLCRLWREQALNNRDAYAVQWFGDKPRWLR